MKGLARIGDDTPYHHGNHSHAEDYDHFRLQPPTRRLME